jgi:hypothetical protein
MTEILAVESTAEYFTYYTDIQVRAAHIFSHFSRDSTIGKTRKWLLRHKKEITYHKQDDAPTIYRPRSTVINYTRFGTLSD